MCCQNWCVKNRWAVQDKKMARRIKRQFRFMSGTGSAVPISAFLLLTSLWPFKEHDSLKLRNCVLVSQRLVAVKGEKPTIKIKPKAHKRRPTKKYEAMEIPIHFSCCRDSITPSNEKTAEPECSVPKKTGSSLCHIKIITAK
jgi:hypothetical protein